MKRIMQKDIQYCLDTMDIDEYIELWNNYCKSYNDDSRVIHYMYDIDRELKDLSVSEIIENCKDIRTNDLYYYGDYEYYSTDDIYDVCDDYELIQAILDELDSYGNDEIEHILFDESED